MSKLLAVLLLFWSPLLWLLREAGPTHDYVFSVTGLVTAEDGTPLRDAEVELEVHGPVSEGTTPVKIVKRVTDNGGGFAFMYTSHKRGVRYSVTVQKEGFEPQTVSGSAPPAGNHTFHLVSVKHEAASQHE
jgi:hypothetical protein